MTNVSRLILWISVSLAVGVVVHVVMLHVLGHQPQRSIRSDVVQGIIAGGVLGFIRPKFSRESRPRRSTADPESWLFAEGR